MKRLFYAFVALFIAGISGAAIAQPVLSSSLTPPAICDSTMFNYIPASATAGVSFYWSRAFVPGIGSLSGSGPGEVHELLKNNTNISMNVAYTYTLVAGTDTTVQNVTVTVLPTPLLVSDLTTSVCSGTLFAYTPNSLTPGVSYAWSRAAVTGISAAAASGTGSISEVLVSSSAGPVVATYQYTLSVNECHYPATVAVTVFPVAGAITGDTAVCVDGTAQLHDAIGGGTWACSNGLATVSATGLVTGVSPGADTVIYTVANAVCTTTATKQSIIVDTCGATAVAQVSLPQGICVYPNPSKGNITFYANGPGALQLYAADGRLMKVYTITERSTAISLPDGLAEAMYLCVFKGTDGQRSIVKIMYSK